jgi:hypothetical protein
LSHITPAKLYELFKQKKINKRDFLNRIITIYEFSDSEKSRIECLKTIDFVNLKTEKIFKFLEEVVISDPDIEVRLSAVSLALKRFPENGYNLVNYIFNSSESKEFVARIAKVIGETMVSSDKTITNELSQSLKSMILKIFENEDVKSFEILWGDWFHKVSGDFWDFLPELKKPIGYLEIMDYFISNHKIYGWFYKYILTKLNFTHWVLFFNNSRFSGRFFYILSFLEEESSSRFYQIIKLFEQYGKNLDKSQICEIEDLIRNNNQYGLVLILIFHWLYYFNDEALKQILEDSDLGIILRIANMVSITRFGFLKHDYFLYSLVLFLLKVSKVIDEKYIEHFFSHISPRIRDEFISKLSKMMNYKEGNNLPEKKKAYIIKFKATSNEFLEVLSKYYGIE